LAQQDRARHPRRRAGTNGQSIERVIFDVVKQFGDPWKLKAKQFWQPFIDRLRARGLDPVVVSSAGDEKVQYGGAAKRTLSQGQFANLVSSVRKQFPRN
jgi:hypothetical protein